MNLTNRVFYINVVRNRVDISRWLALLLLGGMAVAWAAHLGDGHFWTGLLSAAALLAAIHVALSKVMGSSKLGSVVIAAASLVVFWRYDAAQLGQLSTVMTLLLLLLAYVRKPKKSYAVALGLAVGAAAAVVGDRGVLFISLALIFIACRLAWQFLFERKHKKQLLLSVVKLGAIAAISIAVYAAFRNDYTLPWERDGLLAYPDIPLIMTVVLALLALRGLWGTMLLKTLRSPERRLLRLNMIIICVVPLAIATMLRFWGSDVLLPSVVASLERSGFASYNPELLIFTLFGVALFAAHGIDRSLFVDATKPSSIRKRLG